MLLAVWEGSHAPPPWPCHLQIVILSLPPLGIQTEGYQREPGLDLGWVVENFPVQCLEGDRCMGSSMKACIVI
jgi:hypothetical protein